MALQWPGYLVSEVDSTPGEEARVHVCCAAMRARLAQSDGSDSLAWKAFAAQIERPGGELLNPDFAEDEGTGVGLHPRLTTR